MPKNPVRAIMAPPHEGPPATTCSTTASAPSSRSKAPPAHASWSTPTWTSSAAWFRRITPNGFLTMQMLGGWLDQALPDQRWIILGSKGPVHAVTGIRDIHVVPAEDRTKVFPRDSLMLDVGAHTPAEAAALGLSPGDPVIPDAPFTDMNGTGNYLGKAWDDRIGCAALLMAMERTAKSPHPNQIFYVATVQEEIGLRGARTAAQIVKPDIGIALEGGIVRRHTRQPPRRNPGHTRRRPRHLPLRLQRARQPQGRGFRRKDSRSQKHPAPA